MTALVLRADARCLPLPDACVDLVVTSPPYFGLRSYTDGGAHYEGQIGSEGTPAEWLSSLVECTREWVRVLKPSGSIFVNLGDKYAGTDGGGGFSAKSTLAGFTSPGVKGRRLNDVPRAKLQDGARQKSLLGLPWRYALACTDELGLILRRDIVWAKPNGLPESVTDRCRSSHEYVFHLVVQPRYYAAVDEIREPQDSLGRKQGGSNGRDHQRGDARRSMTPPIAALDTLALNPLGKLPGSVWSIPSQPLTVPAHLGVDHFAAFPLELPRRVILGWSPSGVCTVCGEGRRPVVATSYEPTQATNGARKWLGKTSPRHDWPAEQGRQRSLATITGYACACTTDLPGPEYPDEARASRRAGKPLPPTRPAVVLDPFGGTGTTALVASVLGRHGITADLSADYCRLAAWRTTDPGERARAMQVPKPPPVMDGQEALFSL